MRSIFITLLILAAANSVLAHQLPQQINPQIVNNNIVTDYMAFTTNEINQWSEYAKTLDIGTLADKANIPVLISYNIATEAKAEPSIECSIYVDKLATLCGNLDDDSDFMKAALAAIGYCHFREAQVGTSANTSTTQKHFVPYFKGPDSFISSMNETTQGDHHINYAENDGLQFHCVESESSSNVEQAEDNNSNS